MTDAVSPAANPPQTFLAQQPRDQSKPSYHHITFFLFFLWHLMRRFCCTTAELRRRCITSAFFSFDVQRFRWMVLTFRTTVTSRRSVVWHSLFTFDVNLCTTSSTLSFPAVFSLLLLSSHSYWSRTPPTALHSVCVLNLYRIYPDRIFLRTWDRFQVSMNISLYFIYNTVV